MLFLAEGAEVMLTANLWPDVGLCNGAPGTMHHFIYTDRHAPPDLPIAILVEFQNYCGPPFLDFLPKVYLLSQLHLNGTPSLDSSFLFS